MAKKDINNRKKELQEEIQATKDLATVQLELIKNAQTQKALSNEAIGLKEQLLKKLQTEDSLTGQIESIQTTIDGLLKEQIERGEEVNQHYIEQLDSLKSHLDQQKQIAIAQKERNDLNEAGKGILKGLLGINSDIEEAVVSGGMKVLFLNKAFENVSKNVTRMVDGVKEGVTQMGLSVGESMHLQANIEKASFSVTGLLYGQEAVAQSAKAITQEYGSAAAANTDLIKSVTELSGIAGGAEEATRLVHAFENAGVEAGDVKSTIQDVASEVGVSATMAMKGLANQQHMLVGSTKEQLKEVIKVNAELQKSGSSMEKMNELANGMLDIETSMRNEAKARMVLGRDIGSNEMRQLAVQMKTAKGADAKAAVQKQMNDLLLKEIGSTEELANMSDVEREALATAYNMNVEDMTTMAQKAEESAKLEEKYGDYADHVQKAKDIGVMVLSGAKGLGIEMAKAAVQAGVMNMMMGKGSGIGNFFKSGIDGAKGLAKGLTSPIKSLGSLKDKAVAAFKGKAPEIKKDIMPDKEKISSTVEDGGKASGKGGMKDKLKDMAEGLKAMGDGKVFAGIGAVALAGPAFIVALPSIPFLLFMGKVKLKALKENFTGLAEGLSQMSATFMGSLALGTFAIAAIPSILGIPFLLFFGKVKLKALEENFGSLGRGLAQMTQGILGALTLLIAAPALALGMLAIPFLAFMSIPGLGAMLSANFTGLAAGLAAFGNPATAVFVLIGIGLMALLGAAMIPFAYALSLLTPPLEAFGNIVIGVMGAIPPIIGAMADGFIAIGTALTPEMILAFFALGPALLLASVGMLAFGLSLGVAGIGSFFGGGIIDDIKELAMTGPMLQMAGEGMASVTESFNGLSSTLDTVSASLEVMGGVSSQLYVVAGGLYSIAGGLGAISIAGLIATPTFAALGSLAAMAPTLKSLGEFFGIGGGDNSSTETTVSTNDNSNKELLSEIKGLRQDLQSQPIVLNIDGKAVSRIQRVGRQQGNNRGAYSK